MTPPGGLGCCQFKAVILLWCSHCLLVLPLFVGHCGWSLCFVSAVLSILFSFARELVALLLLSYGCLVTVDVL